MLNKKILTVFVLVLTLAFTTKALASLTFTSNAITGTTASTIDLGTGNTLSLQTTTNAPITIGTGLVTLGGSLNVSGNVVVTGTVRAVNIYEDGSLYNLAFGSDALSRSTTGNSNTAIGRSSQLLLTSGSDNTAVGLGTQYNLEAGNGNTAFGSNAQLELASGSNNTAVGYGSQMTRVTGSSNTAIGKYSHNGLTSGSNNTAVGENSGAISGASPSSLYRVSTSTNTTFLGYQSGLGSATQRTNSTAIGAGAYVDADNTVVLGNASVTNVLMGSTSGATVNAGKYKLSALNTAPATSSEACTAGEIRYTATYIYLCSATNTWVRSAFTSF